MKIYNVFHISLLKPNNKINDDNSSTVFFIVVEEKNKYKGKKIFDSSINYR